MHNLAASDGAEGKAALLRLRGVLEKWIEDVGDQGRIMESAATVTRESGPRPAKNPDRKKNR